MTVCVCASILEQNMKHPPRQKVGNRVTCTCMYLWWVDDCYEVLDTIHPQVGDGEGTSDELMRLELATASLLCQLLYFSIDCPQALSLVRIKWRSYCTDRSNSNRSSRYCTYCIKGCIIKITNWTLIISIIASFPGHLCSLLVINYIKCQC